MASDFWHAILVAEDGLSGLDLPGLLPTTATSFMLVVLLRIWVLERRSGAEDRTAWYEEREALVKAHREELAEKRQQRLEERALLLKEREDAVRVAVADYETHVRFLRERITQCEAELEAAHAQLRGRKAAGGDGPGARG